jgi:hypothetical protein
MAGVGIVPYFLPCNRARIFRKNRSQTAYTTSPRSSAYLPQKLRRAPAPIGTCTDDNLGTDSHGVSDPSGQARDRIQLAHRGRSRHGYCVGALFCADKGGTRRRPSTAVSCCSRSRGTRRRGHEMPLPWRISESLRGTTSEIAVVPWVVLSRCDMTTPEKAIRRLPLGCRRCSFVLFRLVVGRPARRRQPGARGAGIGGPSRRTRSGRLHDRVRRRAPSNQPSGSCSPDGRATADRER